MNQKFKFKISTFKLWMKKGESNNIEIINYKFTFTNKELDCNDIFDNIEIIIIILKN